MALEIRPEEIGRYDRAAYQRVHERLYGVTPMLVKARKVELYDEPIGPARVIFRDIIILEPLPNGIHTFRAIRNAALEKYGLTIEQFEGDQRGALFSKCRREVWYETHKQTKLSLPNIGRLSGGKDHTSVYRAIERYVEIESGIKNPALDANRARSYAAYLSRRDTRSRRKASAAAVVEG